MLKNGNMLSILVTFKLNNYDFGLGLYEFVILVSNITSDLKLLPSL